jgi:DNA-binding FadR family transcriptional regulator
LGRLLGEDDIVGLINLDIQFHGLIGVATGNKTLNLLMDTITRFLSDGWKATLRVQGRVRKTVTEHEKIRKAIMQRDEKQASLAMERHLRHAIQNLRDEGLE